MLVVWRRVIFFINFDFFVVMWVIGSACIRDIFFLDASQVSKWDESVWWKLKTCWLAHKCAGNAVKHFVESALHPFDRVKKAHQRSSMQWAWLKSFTSRNWSKSARYQGITCTRSFSRQVKFSRTIFVAVFMWNYVFRYLYGNLELYSKKSLWSVWHTQVWNEEHTAISCWLFWAADIARPSFDCDFVVTSSAFCFCFIQIARLHSKLILRNLDTRWESMNVVFTPRWGQWGFRGKHANKFVQGGEEWCDLFVDR